MKTGNRFLVLAGLAGVALLVGSVAGSRRHDQPPVPAPPPSAGSPSERSAVSIGYVDVEGGVTPLYPLQPGRVDKVHVKENEPVKANAVLLTMDRRLSETLLRQAESALEAAKAQFEQARARLEQQRLREEQQQSAIAAVRSKLRGAEALLARREELRNLQSGAREIEAASAQVEELKAVLHAEEKKLEELRLIDPKLDVRRARAELRMRRAQRDQAKVALDECELRAPVDGIVLRVLVSRGETLGAQARQPAILFCPNRPRIIRAEVEQEFAHRIQVGQKAVIVDDTVSGERWTGKVERLSDWFTHRRSIIPEPLQLNDVRTLECIVTVDADQPPLRIGQRVRVVLSNQ